jgi:hypothetical protein
MRCLGFGLYVLGSNILYAYICRQRGREEAETDCDWASEAETEEEKKGGVEVMETQQTRQL